jgi:hypothetical protein
LEDEVARVQFFKRVSIKAEQAANQETGGWLPLKKAILKERGKWKRSVVKERPEEEFPL